MSDLPPYFQTAVADRYRLDQQIGLAGGMSMLFLAEDLRHRRSVVIKVLDPRIGALIGPEWFLREIEIVARLTHPHIIPLFDSGAVQSLLYYVMPYLPGESLRERLDRDGQWPVEESLRLVRVVGDALDHAHRQGVVHLDVKPDNIRLMHGHGLIGDFGIARAIEVASRQTHSGIVAGTPLYMSPEQIDGRPVDGRSDQYSLACVLFEMLAGRPPFVGPLADRVMMQHLEAVPRPLTDFRTDVAPPLSDLLARALAKDPAERFASVLALCEALEQAHDGMAAAGAKPMRRLMLAVLPLEHLASDAEQEYFADGATEELISQIGRLRPQQLGVIARTSAMRYKRSSKSIGEIGRELMVDYVLEGSVRRGGERVRINAQLIRVSDQSQLWSSVYERDPSDMLALQSGVATDIAQAIANELLPAKAVTTKTANPAAYEAYLRGRHLRTRGAADHLRLATVQFEEAAQLDPEFARAHAALAECLLLEAQAGSPRETLTRAKAVATRAVELDPDSAEALASMAAVRFDCDRDWSGAERDFLRAIDLDPGYSTAHHWYGMLLMGMGRFEASRFQLDRARELDPFSATVAFSAGDLSLCERQFVLAAQRFRQALELNPEFHTVHLMLGLALAFQGRFAAALAETDLSLERERSCSAVAILAQVSALAGRKDDAHRLLRELGQRASRELVRPDMVAAVYAALGEKDEAFQWLKHALEGPAIALLDLKVGPRFEALDGDPRYAELIRAIGLEA